MFWLNRLILAYADGNPPIPDRDFNFEGFNTWAIILVVILGACFIGVVFVNRREKKEKEE